MLSRASHLNDNSWETRGVSSERKCFKQGKKGVVQKGMVPDTPFVPPLIPGWSRHWVQSVEKPEMSTL